MTEPAEKIVVQLVHEQPVGQAEYEAAMDTVQWIRERVLRDLDEVERLLRHERFGGDVA